MKAIALISGGLDSILAAKIIQGQGIDVVPLTFRIPFSQGDKLSSAKNRDKLNLVEDNLGADLKIVDIGSDFLRLIENPGHGFGSNMNPCIDCKILMLCKSAELMKEWGAAFIVTGEVLGQRPMSQHRQALNTIVKKAGLEGLVLRPLSAKLLAETKPEKEGWVEREELFNFSGRARRRQLELARVLGIKEYAQPAGGCLLTDPEFSKRLKELVVHKELTLDNAELLKIGRHFRVSADTKLVVGRNERENEELSNLAKEKDYLFFPGPDLAGPTCLGRGEFNEDLIKLCCQITCRYCDLDGKEDADIIYKIIPEKEAAVIKASVLDEKGLAGLRI